jgi:putative phosphoesterase
MKLGLMADIHADHDALCRALAILAREQVEMILCAGDLVEKGVQGEAVVADIRARAIPCVLGNHDQLAPDTQVRLRAKMALGEAVDERELLSTGSLAFLAELPFERRYTFSGLRILVVHGSPRRNTEYLLSLTPAIKFQNLAHEVNADVVICGHTHEPMHIRAAGAHFINPGAVCGTSAYGSHTCAVFDLSTLHLTVFDLKTGASVEYDDLRMG